jgi:Dolichyl-phosphate-mannose-protein mannosyltransferase
MTHSKSRARKSFNVNPTTQRIFTWLTANSFMLVVAACAIAHGFILFDRIGSDHPMDVIYGYIPNAKRLLEMGLFAFLSDPAAIRAPLLTTVWFALFNAEPISIRYGHSVLSALSVCLAAASAYVVAGRIAGIAAAALWAFSPLVERYGSHALVESPFWFFTWCWLAAFLCFCKTGARRWLLAAVVLGGLGLSIRPLFLYPSVAVLLLLGTRFLWLRFRPPPSNHLNLDARIAWGVSLPLLVPIVFMAINAVHHQFFSLSTGAGAAIYLGLHPLNAGVDPPIYKFGYDAIPSGGGEDHLTLASDRRLRRVAARFAKQRTAQEWLAFATHKASLSLLLGPEEQRTPGALRAWRAAILVLACVGFFAYARRGAALAFALISLLCFAQTIPILHNTRYAAGALEVSLTFWAALGAGALLSRVALVGQWNARSLGVSLRAVNGNIGIHIGKLALILGLCWGAYQAMLEHHARTTPSVSLPVIFAFTPSKNIVTLPKPEIVRVDAATLSKEGWVQGTSGIFAANYRVTLPEDIENRAAERNVFWAFNLEKKSAEGARACRRFELAYVPAVAQGSEIEVEPFVTPEADGSHQIVVSATQEFSKISPLRSGELRILAHCPVGSAFLLKNLRFEVSDIVEDAKLHVRKK